MALLKVNEGDIVAIPAKKDDAWGFVLARVIFDNQSITWIEVFEQFSVDFSISKEEISFRDFSQNARLFPPIYASFDFNRYFGKIKWPILFSDPSYNREQSGFSDIEFETLEYDEFGIYFKGFTKECIEKKGVRRNLQDKQIFSNPQLVHRINLYFSGYFKKGEPWNFKNINPLIHKMGKDWWVDGINACNDEADAVALKFKELSKRRKSRVKI